MVLNRYVIGRNHLSLSLVLSLLQIQRDNFLKIANWHTYARHILTLFDNWYLLLPLGGIVDTISDSNDEREKLESRELWIIGIIPAAVRIVL